MPQKRFCSLLRLTACIVLVTFTTTTLMPRASYAQAPALPAPGIMVQSSVAFVPPMLKGVIVHPEKPFHFDFIFDSGDAELSKQEISEESKKLIKYFLASLTMPEDELWVNLSPYEKDRIIPDEFAKTDMGRDLLVQDYLLKQLTASLIYPKDDLGKKFWDRVYKKAKDVYGTTAIPVDTFNKVWIVPEKALVYENGDRAFVVESHLRVMLESDYLAQGHQSPRPPASQEDAQAALREIILPEIEQEINKGKNFATLRQIYHSFILASWYKKKLMAGTGRDRSLLGKTYVDQKKVEGLEIADTNAKEKIYAQYLEAFKKGVYNFIKEDYDPHTQQVIPRKYFSGGVMFRDVIEPTPPHDVTHGEVFKISSRFNNSVDTAMVANEEALFQRIRELGEKGKKPREIENILWNEDFKQTFRDIADQYPSIPELFGLLLFERPLIQAVLEKGWNLTQIAEEAKKVLDNEVLSEFARWNPNDAYYQDQLRYAFLVSDEAREAFVEFVTNHSESLESLLMAKRWRQPLALFLANPETRHQTAMFIRHLVFNNDFSEPNHQGRNNDHPVVMGHNPAASFFWHYVAPLFDGFREKIGDDKAAAEMLLYFHNNFYRILDEAYVYANHYDYVEWTRWNKDEIEQVAVQRIVDATLKLKAEEEPDEAMLIPLNVALEEMQDESFFSKMKLLKTLGAKQGDRVVNVGGWDDAFALDFALGAANLGLHYVGYDLKQHESVQAVLSSTDLEANGGSAQQIAGEFSSSSTASKIHDDHTVDFVLMLTGVLSDPLPESDQFEVFQEVLRVIKNGGKFVVGSHSIGEIDEAKETIETVINSPEWKGKVKLHPVATDMTRLNSVSPHIYLDLFGIYEVEFITEDQAMVGEISSPSVDRKKREEFRLHRTVIFIIKLFESDPYRHKMPTKQELSDGLGPSPTTFFNYRKEIHAGLKRELAKEKYDEELRQRILWAIKIYENLVEAVAEYIEILFKENVELDNIPSQSKLADKLWLDQSTISKNYPAILNALKARIAQDGYDEELKERIKRAIVKKELATNNERPETSDEAMVGEDSPYDIISSLLKDIPPTKEGWGMLYWENIAVYERERHPDVPVTIVFAPKKKLYRIGLHEYAAFEVSPQGIDRENERLFHDIMDAVRLALKEPEKARHHVKKIEAARQADIKEVILASDAMDPDELEDRRQALDQLRKQNARLDGIRDDQITWGLFREVLNILYESFQINLVVQTVDDILARETEHVKSVFGANWREEGEAALLDVKKYRTKGGNHIEFAGNTLRLLKDPQDPNRVRFMIRPRVPSSLPNVLRYFNFYSALVKKGIPVLYDDPEVSQNQFSRIFLGDYNSKYSAHVPFKYPLFPEELQDEDRLDEAMLAAGKTIYRRESLGNRESVSNDRAMVGEKLFDETDVLRLQSFLKTKEEIELYHFLGKSLNLAGARVIEVGRGINAKPQEGLERAGVQEVLPINLTYDDHSGGWMIGGIVTVTDDDGQSTRLGEPFKRIPFRNRWSGVDAGGFKAWLGRNEKRVGAVVFNYSLDYVVAHPRPNLREPLSWLNWVGLYERYPIQRWSRAKRAFAHAWDALESGGWIIIKHIYPKDGSSLRWRVSEQAREKIPEVLRQKGFQRIQIITKDSEDGFRGTMLVVAQKPIHDAQLKSEEDPDQAMLAAGKTIYRQESIDAAIEAINQVMAKAVREGKLPAQIDLSSDRMYQIARQFERGARSKEEFIRHFTSLIEKASHEVDVAQRPSKHDHERQSIILKANRIVEKFFTHHGLPFEDFSSEVYISLNLPSIERGAHNLLGTIFISPNITGVELLSLLVHEGIHRNSGGLSVRWLNEAVTEYLTARALMHWNSVVEEEDRVIFESSPRRQRILNSSNIDSFVRRDVSKFLYQIHRPNYFPLVILIEYFFDKFLPTSPITLGEFIKGFQEGNLPLMMAAFGGEQNFVQVELPDVDFIMANRSPNKWEALVTKGEELLSSLNSADEESDGAMVAAGKTIYRQESIERAVRVPEDGAIIGEGPLGKILKRYFPETKIPVIHKIGRFHRVSTPWMQEKKTPPGFNYNQIEEDVFWEGPLYGRDISLFRQKWPYVLRHFLIVPQRKKKRPQILELSDIEFAMRVVQEQPMKNFRLTFFSRKAGSIDHLHLHAFVVPDELFALERTSRRQIYNEGNVEISEVADYLFKAFVFSSDDVKELNRSVYVFIRFLQDSGVMHSVLFAPQGIYVLLFNSEYHYHGKNVSPLGFVWEIDEIENISGISEEDIKSKMMGLSLTDDEFRALHQSAFLHQSTDVLEEDKALLSESPGGIDFNPQHLNLQTQGRGVDVRLPEGIQDFEPIEIKGLVPVIINITPVTNIPMLLGEADGNPGTTS